MGKYKDINTRQNERERGIKMTGQLTVSYDKNSETVVIALDDRGLALHMDEAASVFVDLGHILQDVHFKTKLERKKENIND
tara:strand:+ start:2954 stop:3196 length:243 start_codon:yes stop_codon:yes gene_type:complete